MSKTKFLLYIFIITSTFSFSQSYEDVLRYNSFSQEGTSRFNAMGGAFGALGGDVSGLYYKLRAAYRGKKKKDGTVLIEADKNSYFHERQILYWAK